MLCSARVLQAQFTVNPSRVSEINIPEDIATGEHWLGVAVFVGGGLIYQR